MFIKTSDLSYTYMKGTPFETDALFSVNVDIKEGQFVLIIGSTGSGKSTLVQHFNALIKPQCGKVYVLGKDILSKEISFKKLRQEVGLAFQFPESQIFEETIYADIAFGPRRAGLSEDEISLRIEEYLKWIGITKEEANKRSPFTVSGGQMRKIALAGIMIMNPRVLILDEPTVSLDPKSSKEILERIKLLHNTKNITVIIVSHDLKELISHCDRILIMNKGRNVFFGDYSDLIKNRHVLKDSSLTLPDYTEILEYLSLNGIDIKKDAISENECVKEILKHWN